MQEKAVESKLRQQNISELKERLAKLTVGLPPADKKMEELLKSRREGYLKAKKPDATHGLAVFEKSCAICHQVGGKGAKFGPQLDGVGIRGVGPPARRHPRPQSQRGPGFPHHGAEPKERPGRSGLLLKEEGEVLVLADAMGKELRVPKNTVDEKQISPLSPMPANFADQIPEKEFYDLLAYLLAQRPAANNVRKQCPSLKR